MRRLGRPAVLVTALALLLGVLAIVSGHSGDDARPPSAARSSQPLLRMPFERGTVVLCMQGNRAPADHTHRSELPQNEYALDFSSPVGDVVYVVSAAQGKVERIYEAAAPGHVNAGRGYGNQVKIAHGQGYFTFYAHLDRVLVRSHQTVASGTRIGTMGMTGRAGTRHLHFSLHRGPAIALGSTRTELMERLLALELDGSSAEFRVLRSDELVASYETPWRGQLYASENTPDHPAVFGPPEESLRAGIHRAVLAARQALERRGRLAAIADGRAQHDPAWVLDQLEPVLEADPDHPLALYLQAVAVKIPAGHLSEAEATLRAALTANAQPRRFEPWLPGRAHFQLGRIARRQGDTERARRHLEQAIDLSTTGALLHDAKAELAMLLR